MSDDTRELAESELETATDPGEQETAEQPEAETEEVEAEETQEESETETSEEQETEEPEVELETVEWEGETFQIPKKLKSGLMMQADYTRKTQEVAERRKELDQQAEQLTQQSQATEEELNMRGQLGVIQAELQRYQQVDWETLEQTDQASAQSHWRRYQQLKDTAQTVSGQLEHKQTERAEQAKQATATRLQETRRYAETQIPGWTPEVDAKVTHFATQELGFDQDTLKQAYNPQIYRALHLAWLGHQTLNKPASKPKPPATKPTTTVSGKSNPAARKSLADMDMEEYAAHRRKQMERG